MRLPKISIITPSFNQGQFLEQTIISVLDQQYPNLEYIIIDGGSVDNSLEIIKKYSKYLAHWTSEKDKGQSDAINKGLKLSSGELINWLNSDDYYASGTLKHVGSIFSDPDINCYCGRSRIFSSQQEYISQGSDVYFGNLAKTIGWARIDQPETFYRKRVWDKLQQVNEDFHFVMDKELWVRYLLHFGLKGIIKDDRVLVNFRIHDQSKTGFQLEKFRQETFNLFYSLAKGHNPVLAQNIAKIFPVQEKPLFGYEDIHTDIYETALNYFIQHVVLEAYAQDDYSLARNAASLLDTSLLEVADQKELEKVLFRMKYMPASIKKGINKARRQLGL